MACSEIIDDIEDLITSQDIQPKERYANKKDVTLRKKTKNVENGTDIVEEKVLKTIITSDLVPSDHKIFVKTWGCSHNNSDSEYMAGQVHENNFENSFKFTIHKIFSWQRMDII